LRFREEAIWDGLEISGSTKGDLSYVCLVKLDEHCYLTRNFYIRKIRINIWQNFNELCHLIFFFFVEIMGGVRCKQG
jgi:hypothetical protein